MLQSAKSSSQANLFQGPIKKLPILLPPLDLQRELEQHISAIATLKTQCQAHVAELDALFASLQHRAFNGELWPDTATA